MLTIMASRTTFHQFSLLGQQLKTEIAYRMDLHALGALSQTCKTMNAIAKLPLLYVKFRVESGKNGQTKLPQAPELEELPDWTKRHLEKFVLRLKVIERFPEFNQVERAQPERAAPKRHHRSASQPLPIAPDLESKRWLVAVPGEARPKVASQHDVFKRLKNGASKNEILLETKTMQPLEALQMLSANFELLLGDMGKESAQALSEALQRIPIPGKNAQDFSAAVDAYLALVRAAHKSLCARKKKSGISKFMSTVFLGTKDFILKCSIQRVQESDRPKLHMLIGELLRGFAHAKHWDLDATSAEFKSYFVGVGALSFKQWDEALALATSHQEKPRMSYLELTLLEVPAPEAKEQRKTEQLGNSSQGVELSMPAPEAMKYLSSNFEKILGHMDTRSGKVLERVLERAANPEVWKDNSSAAMDTHSELLRAIGKAFFAHRKDRRKEVAEFKALTLNALREFIVLLVESRDVLSPGRLQLFLGELLRTYAFGSSAAERKKLSQHPELCPLLVETGLMSREEWKEVLQRATSRMDEALTYLDLMTAHTATIVSARTENFKARHSAQVLRPLQDPSPDSGKAKRSHQRSASMSAVAPMPKSDEGCVELETPEEAKAEETDNKPNNEAREARQDGSNDKGNCVLS